MRGALFTGAAQAYRVGLGFVSGIALARLLTPADFGLVAMAGTCVAFVSLIQDLGLGQATIQRDMISNRQASALFWLSSGVSVGLAVLLALSAPGVAWFFGDSRLTLLTAAFAVLVALGGAQSQPAALMNRELRFKALAAIDVVIATASACAGVSVAYLTGSYWALFASALAATLGNLLCVWPLSGFRPGRPSFEGAFREIVGFGSSISGFNIVNYFARNADNLLIGKFYGSQQLGYYDRAYRLLTFPLQQTTWPLGRVMLPLLSRLQSDPDRYRKAYTECISLLMMATQPGIIFMVVFAHDVFRIVLGPQWLLAVPIFQWLGMCGLHQVVTSTTGWLFVSQGRGVDFLKIGVLNAGLTVLSFLIGLPWGALGVAISYTICNYAAIVPCSWWAAGRRGAISTFDIMTTVKPHALGCMAAGAIFFKLSAVVDVSNPIRCFALLILSYVIYGSVMLTFLKTRTILSAILLAFIATITRRTHRVQMLKK